MSYFNFNKNKNRKRGFIGAIFMVVIALVILGFFVDFKPLTESKRLQDNYQYLKTLAVSVWENYLSTTAHYIWNKIILEYIYKDIFINFIWPKIHLKAP